MKKSDVTFHREGFGDALPAVNVKNYGSFSDIDFSKMPDWGMDGPVDLRYNLGWIEEHVSDSQMESAWEQACETCWEAVQTDAEEIWGYKNVKVESQGRMGGWAVVHGLKDFDSWNAIDLAKWAKFCKWARQQAGDLHVQIAIELYRVFETKKPLLDARMDRTVLAS